MSADIVNVVVAALTGGGIFKAIDSLWTARAMAKKTDAESAAMLDKTPAEVDSITVQGAEQAVLTMQSALTTANQQIEQLTGRVRDLEKRFGDAEAKAQAAEVEARDARRAADDSAHTITSLRAEVARLTAATG